MRESSQGFSNEDSFVATLFKTHEQMLRRYAYTVCEDDELINDSIQELFLKFCEKPDLAKKINNTEAYLKVSLRRIILEKSKKRTTQSDVGRLVEIAVPSYEDFLIKQQTDQQAAKRMRDCLNQLSSQQKTILTLRFFRGMSYDAIAEKLSIANRTVYNQIHRAIKKLRETHA